MTNTDLDQIIQSLKEKLAKIVIEPEKAEEFGVIESVGDGIAYISGLANIAASESVKIHTKNREITGMAINLEETRTGIIIFGESRDVRIGDRVTRTNQVMSIPVSEDLIGRVVNPLGEPIDDKGGLKNQEGANGHSSVHFEKIEKIAPGVINRESVRQPLHTGIKIIDGIIPIGRGQRELIIGDRGTGKTALAIDAIIHQGYDAKSRGLEPVICIYVSIGQKKSKVAKLVAKLEEEGAMAYSLVVSATASDPASLNFIAPYAGCSIGEYFMNQGRNVLIVYDDLSKHAWAYREISLLLRRPPGREAYPGDIFYLHSRLLERAAKLNQENGGGSLTALPIIETQAGDLSAYIPTNVISITDGQIFLEPNLFYQGIRPAVNPGLSVSRVGSSAQIKAMKKVAGQLRLSLAQYRELAAFAQFGSDLDEETKKTIERGKRMTELLKQRQYQTLPVEEQVASIFAVSQGLFDKVEVEKISETEELMLAHLRKSQAKILENIRSKGEMNEDEERELKEEIEKIVK